MTRIDGKQVAQELKEEIREQVTQMKARGIEPCLAVILVGDDPASRVYVTNKEKDCAECGIVSREYKLPEKTQEEELLQLIAELNADRSVHGILVQLPLPRQIHEGRVIAAIDPDKDVDSFHPYNVGSMMLGNDRFLPCTPAGVMKLLDYYHIDPAGKQCVGAGPQQHCGQAPGNAAAAPQRHSHYLPLQDRESEGAVSKGGYSGLRCGQAKSHHGGHGEGRRSCHRCLHQPQGGRQALWGCLL